MAKNTRTISFSLDEPTITRLESRQGRMSRTERLTVDLQMIWSTLDIGLARAKKKLTKNEARLILDVQNGTFVESGPASSLWLYGEGLAFQISDALTLDQLDKKWEVDGPDLVKRIQTFDAVETLSLLDWASRFWNAEAADQDDFVEGFQD